MARKKRTALDKEISRAQKNTRAKLYRLRKRGAANTDELSPIESTKDMNGSQKAAYLRRLKRFNERSNSFVVQENNVAIPKQKLEEFRKAEAKANAARMEFRNKIIKARETGAKKHIAKLQKAVDDERRRMAEASRTGKPYKPLKKNLDTMRSVGAVPKAYADRDITLDVMKMALEQSDKVMRVERRGKFADIMPFIMKEDFESVKALERETKALKEAKKDIGANRARYGDWKKGIISRMSENGYGDLTDEIRALSDAQMDWLHYFTEFDQLTNAFRYREEMDMGIAGTRQETLDYNYEEISRLLQVAKTVKR